MSRNRGALPVFHSEEQIMDPPVILPWRDVEKLEMKNLMCVMAMSPQGVEGPTAPTTNP